MEVVALLEPMEILVGCQLRILLLLFAFVEAGDSRRQVQVNVPAALCIRVCKGLVVELLSDEGEHRRCLVGRADDAVRHDVHLLPSMRSYL